jgi:hypothetical protein
MGGNVEATLSLPAVVEMLRPPGTMVEQKIWAGFYIIGFVVVILIVLRYFGLRH